MPTWLASIVGAELTDLSLLLSWPSDLAGDVAGPGDERHQSGERPEQL
jgi:hypothetical protein